MVSRSQATQRPRGPTAFPRVEHSRISWSNEGLTSSAQETNRLSAHHIVWSSRQARPSEGDTWTHPKTGTLCLSAGAEDTFPRFHAFQRNQMHRSLCAGLPPQRHPLSGFLTLSAVCSRCTLVAVFQATSTRRLPGPSELFPPQSAARSLDFALLSCHQVLHNAHRQADCVCDVRCTPPGEPDGVCSASRETLAPEPCSDRVSDTLRDG
jgi:hypothetical protein